jgi:hypothetical protein
MPALLAHYSYDQRGVGAVRDQFAASRVNESRGKSPVEPLSQVNGEMEEAHAGAGLVESLAEDEVNDLITGEPVKLSPRRIRNFVTSAQSQG